MPISPREARKNFFAFIFSYQDGLSWHLRALHCKFQMYEDCRSRGRHVLLSCSNFAHERNTYVHVDRGLVPKPFGFRQRTVIAS